jgi:aflatoxin B1 aldehyde reductase
VQPTRALPVYLLPDPKAAHYYCMGGMRLSLYERPHGCRTEPGNRVVYDINANEAHFGRADVSGPALLWELHTDEAAAAAAEPELSEEITLTDGPLIMRCDRIDFPPGGVAYRHTHPGPGIRRLVSGSITIVADGKTTEHGVGESWFESGPSPVYAMASRTEPSAFVRVLVLGRQWTGKRTIKYVDPADEEKPKQQKPTVFFDRPAIAPTQRKNFNGIQLVWGIASLDRTDDEPTDGLLAGLQRLQQSGLLEVDVARIYGEAMLSRALTAAPPVLADQIIVNTKASVRTFRDDTILSYDGVKRQLNLSLTAIGRDKVNIFYLHQPDPRALLDDSLRAVNELHQQGMFAEFGLSNFPAWQVMQIFYKCQAEGYVLPTVYQGHYNPLVRQLEAELIPALRACMPPCLFPAPTASPTTPTSRCADLAAGMLGMRLHCYSPLEAGLLGDTRSPRGKPLSERLTGAPPGLVRALRRIDAACAAAGLPKQQCVMRWFFNHSALEPGDAIINGASTIEQLGANLDSLDGGSGPLPVELVAEIDGSWEEHCTLGPHDMFGSFPAQPVAKL